MFYGEYAHSLDDKGRVIVPARFREQFEVGGYVTKESGGCLAVYTREEFDRVANEMQDKQRRGELSVDAVRSFAAGTTEIAPDRQGRVAIPGNLRLYAGLEREVVVIGALNRLEIWEAGRWQQVSRSGEAALNSSSSVPA